MRNRSCRKMSENLTKLVETWCVSQRGAWNERLISESKVEIRRRNMKYIKE